MDRWSTYSSAITGTSTSKCIAWFYVFFGIRRCHPTYLTTHTNTHTQRISSICSLLSSGVNGDIFFTPAIIPWLNARRLFGQRPLLRSCQGLSTCIGFVDGTEQECCRTVIHQRLMYNGHKLHHCTGWQGLDAPNGLIVQLYGPCIGTFNDSKMMGLSRLIDMLEEDFPGYYIYSDQGYGLTTQVQRDFPRSASTEQERSYNNLWSQQRIAVEWSFNQPVTLFPTLDCKRMKKALFSLIGSWYMVGALFANCHAVMKGSNEISQHLHLCTPLHGQF